MPVGFVHVIESKELVMATEIPQVVIKGRRGGSSLAVATLHAIIESVV
jgi:precorrin isomerase